MDEGDPQARRLRWAGGAAAVAALYVILALVLGWWPFAEQLSREEFLAQADEICAEAHEAFTDLQDEPPTTAREAADLTDQLVGIAEDELDEIEGLRGPEDLETATDRYLDAREKGIDLLRDGLDAAEDDSAFVYAEAQSEVAGSQPDRFDLAREVGFTECSRPLSDRAELERAAEPPASIDPQAPPTVANPPTGAP